MRDHKETKVRAPHKFVAALGETNSCSTALEKKSRIRGAVWYNGRLLVCMSSGHKGGNTLSADGWELVKASEYKKVSLPAKGFPLSPDRGYEGLQIQYRGVDYVLTNEIRFETDDRAPMPDTRSPAEQEIRTNTGVIDVW